MVSAARIHKNIVHPCNDVMHKSVSKRKGSGLLKNFFLYCSCFLRYWDFVICVSTVRFQGSPQFPNFDFKDSFIRNLFLKLKLL